MIDWQGSRAVRANADSHAFFLSNDHRKAITKIRGVDGGEDLKQSKAKALNILEIDRVAPRFVLALCSNISVFCYTSAVHAE